MKVKHLLIILVSISAVIIVLLKYNHTMYKNNDMLRLEVVTGPNNISVDKDNSIGVIKSSTPLMNESMDNLTEDSKESTELSDKTITEVNLKEESFYLHITNQFLFYEVLYSEEDEINLISSIYEYFRDKGYKNDLYLTIIDNTIHQKDGVVKFMFYLDETDSYYNLQYNLTSLFTTIEVVSVEDTNIKRNNETLIELQKEYPQSLGKEYKFDKVVYDEIEDLLIDFFLNVSFGFYEDAFKQVGMVKMATYIPDLKYDYSDFILDMQELVMNLKGKAMEPYIIAYLDFDDYYLVQLQLYSKDEIYLEQKWITIFKQDNKPVSLFLEDLQCSRIWKEWY